MISIAVNITPVSITAVSAYAVQNIPGFIIVGKTDITAPAYRTDFTIQFYLFFFFVFHNLLILLIKKDRERSPELLLCLAVPGISIIRYNIPNYDFKTKYYELFNGHNGYIFDKKFILEDIKKFVEKE